MMSKMDEEAKSFWFVFGFKQFEKKEDKRKQVRIVYDGMEQHRFYRKGF